MIEPISLKIRPKELDPIDIRDKINDLVDAYNEHSRELIRLHARITDHDHIVDVNKMVPSNSKPECGEKEDKGEISDGYHTFNELYDHRCLLWINLCLMTPNTSYIIENHLDGWFLLGNITPFGQITYHCPNKYLDLVGKIARSNVKFDGHTSPDVIKRLHELAVSMNKPKDDHLLRSLLPMKEEVKDIQALHYGEIISEKDREIAELKELKRCWDSKNFWDEFVNIKAKAERYEGALRLLKQRWDSLGESCLSTSSYQIVIQALRKE